MPANLICFVLTVISDMPNYICVEYCNCAQCIGLWLCGTFAHVRLSYHDVLKAGWRDIIECSSFIITTSKISVVLWLRLLFNVVVVLDPVGVGRC